METSTFVLDFGPPDTDAFGSAARPRFLGRSLGRSRGPAFAVPSPPRAVGGGPESASAAASSLAVCGRLRPEKARHYSQLLKVDSFIR